MAGDVDAFLRALGKRVRLARQERELTQEQLARAAGMSRSFLSLVELGDRGANVRLLYRLAEELGLPLSELLAGAERGAK
jgi:transcriptional regulator with XRE-family HTH domain